MRSGDWQMLGIGVLGTLVVVLLMAQSPMAIRADGIQFTDGTVQTTAASGPIPGGIPARCHGQVTYLEEYDPMYCRTVGSSVSFTDDYIVPPGYYFMVTDISMGSFFLSGTAGTLYRGGLCERFPGSSRSYCYDMRETLPNWHSQHFTLPYAIIRPGWYPEINNPGDVTTLEFQISGLLVTDP